MSFDLNEIFHMLPPEITDRVISFFRTPSADAMQEHIIELKWARAWNDLKCTSSDSDSSSDSD